jgi:hypothetical protein
MRLKRARSRRSDSVRDADSEVRAETLPASIAEMPEEEEKIDK